MRSHLNRAVFRQLLASEPIAHNGCLRRQLQHHVSQPSRAVTLNRAQRRAFFNIFQQTPQREASEPNMAPGLEKMMELAKMERLNARLPPPKQVAYAVTSFFNYILKSKGARPIQDTHAKYLLASLHYLRQHDALSGIGLEGFQSWLTALRSTTHAISPVHCDLATAIYQDIVQLKSAQRSAPTWPDVAKFARAMASWGGTSSARDIAVDHARLHSSTSPTTSEINVWRSILKGFALEANEEEVLRSLDMMRERGIESTQTWVCLELVHFYAAKNNFEKTAEWYQNYRNIEDRSLVPDAKHDSLLETVLNMCLRTSHMDLGQSIIRDMTAAKPSKKQWDLILEWAVGTGKGADEIDRMLGIMERSNQKLPQKAWRTPDVETINRLVKIAVDRKDPYLAERFINLGRARKIQPDVTTLVYQMEYRLAVNDVDGALAVYKHLQALDLSSNKDVPVVNELLCKMCAHGRQDFASIMNVAADLSDRQVRFEPATVSALSVLHLTRDEIPDVIDLLNTHVYTYDEAERATVRDTLVNYSLTPTSTTAQAWDAYTIFRQVFDETPREPRIQVMNEFFRRERPDMAVHVFNHMRSHTRADTIPTIDTYVSCLLGIARLKDEESLEVVHNQLKLDYNVEPNTHLNNALLYAYTACDLSRTALGFWNEIASSREGPNINTIHLALRACEDSPWGDEKARQIWTKLSRTGIELDQDLWASYAGALVGNGNVTGAIRAMEEAHIHQGLHMDTFLIGTLYNAAPGPVKKGLVETWAKERYPEIWEALQEVGMRVSEETEMSEFNIDRHVEP